MPILIKMNLGCNFECEYCYQKPIRKLKDKEWNLKRVKETIRNLILTMPRGSNQQIVVHGGEPLTMPINILEQLLALSYELTGKSSIQTNGYLITDKHIELFKKYKTSVGISVDGPFQCNVLRGKGNLKDRKKQTERVLKNLNNLVEAGVSTSVITVVHKKNAIGINRDLLKSFILDLHKKGIHGRLNPCGTDDPEISLTIEEAIDFYTDMYKFMEENGIYGWSPFIDILNSLQRKSCVCTFSGCDPYCTPSAISVLHDGSLGVCLRLYNDGKVYLRDTTPTSMRTQLLKETECKGCKWFDYCKGGCSGLSINSDWRHKDRFCEVYKALFELAHNTLKFVGIHPPSVSQISRSRYEHLDHGIRHLDSDIENDHTDGIKHSDTGTTHLDSNFYSKSDHSDGERHVDGPIEHLDSNWR